MSNHKHKFVQDGTHAVLKRQVKSFLIRNDYSYKWLAEQLGMSECSVRQYMVHGKSIPSRRQNAMLCIMRDFDKDRVKHYEAHIIETINEIDNELDNVTVPISIELPLNLVSSYAKKAKLEGKTLQEFLAEKLS